MPKYLKTKTGSIESAVLEAMSPAQQAAIAISKKEKEKNENNYIHAAKMAKEKGEKTFTIGGKEYDVEETLRTEKLVGGQKKLDKDKDGDIDGKDFAMMRKNKKESVEEETLAMKAAKHIASMWEDSAKKAEEKKVKEEEEETPKKKESKTAMTGKPMAGVEVNPKEAKDK